MNKFFKKLNQRTGLEFSHCNQEVKVFWGKMEMLLLEARTDKQKSKITGCNQGDTIHYTGKILDGESGLTSGEAAQLEQGTREVWRSAFVEVFSGPELPALSFKHYFKISVSLGRRLE